MESGLLVRLTDSLSGPLDLRRLNFSSIGTFDSLPEKYFKLRTDWKESLAKLDGLKLTDVSRPACLDTWLFRASFSYVIYILWVNHADFIHNGFYSSDSRLAPQCANANSRFERCTALEATGPAQCTYIVGNASLTPFCEVYSDKKNFLGYLSSASKRFSWYVWVNRTLSMLIQWYTCGVYNTAITFWLFDEYALAQWF